MSTLVTFDPRSGSDDCIEAAVSLRRYVGATVRRITWNSFLVEADPYHVMMWMDEECFNAEEVELTLPVHVPGILWVIQ